MIRCPGCGGANVREAASCEWCRRSFVQMPAERGKSTLWWVVLSAGIVTLLLVAIGAVAGLGAIRSAPRAAAAPTATTLALPPLPPLSTSVSSAMAQPTDTPLAKPAAVVTPTLPAAAAGRLARIANTDGRGANLRREPDPNAGLVTTVPETALVRILGPEQRGGPDQRLFRKIDDQIGHEGWVLADVLVEVPR